MASPKSSHYDSSVLGAEDPFKSRGKLVHSNGADGVEAFRPRDKLVHSNDATEPFQTRPKLIHSNSDIDPERLRDAVASHKKLGVQTGSDYRVGSSTQPQSPTSMSMNKGSPTSTSQSKLAMPEFLHKAADTITHAVNAIGLAVEEEAARLKAQYHAYRAQDEKKQLGDRVAMSTQSTEELALAAELANRKHQELLAAGLARGGSDAMKSNAP